MTEQEKAIFKYRWLLNRGDRMCRFGCNNNLNNEAISDCCPLLCLLNNATMKKYRYICNKIRCISKVC